jgi:hypothetical protein
MIIYPRSLQLRVDGLSFLTTLKFLFLEGSRLNNQFENMSSPKNFET